MDDVTRGVFERLARLEDQLLRMRATPAIPAYAQLSDAGDFGREGRVIYAEAEGALYVDTGSAWEEASGGGTGVTDHGALTGLSDDDHAQYHTDARGDARYWQLSTDLATQAELDAHKTSSDHDGRYYTEAEVDASLAAKANTSHTHTATDVTDFDTQVRTSKIHQLAVPTAATPMNGYGFTGLGDLAWPTITLSNSASGVLNIASSGATSKLDLGSKTAISFYDTWLRLNNDGDFASGIYCGTGIFRTDGQLQVGAAGATFLVNGATITHQSNTVWTSGNDGASSGLDADLLDGQHGSYYQQAIATGGLGIDKLDIDGGTDIGAALADADLIIVDDGAGGTNRKSALSRVYTYIASKLTGAISSVLTSNLTASRAVVSDGSGKLSASAVTSTEIGYLSGVTSGLQAQLGAKAALASPALTGTPTAPTAAQGTNTTQLATTAYVQTESGLLVPKSIGDAKGDLVGFSGADTPAKIDGSAASNGDVLTFNSGETPGVGWYRPGRMPTLEMLKAMGSAALAASVEPYDVNTTFGLSSGRVQLSAVLVPHDVTLTGVWWIQWAQGVYTASSNNKIGLYTVSGSTFTRVAQSTNDGTLWKGAATTFAQKAFSAPYAASAGIYFVASLWCSSATSVIPSTPGASHPIGFQPYQMDCSVGLSMGLAGQTDLPASITTAGAIGGTYQFGVY